MIAESLWEMVHSSSAMNTGIEAYELIMKAKNRF